MGREYPSVRKALLGQSDNGVANLWCGVKWLLWQTTYLAIALFIAALGLVLLPFYLIGKFLGGGERIAAAGEWLGEKLWNFATHDYTSKAVRWTLIAVLVGSAALLAGMLVHGLIYNPEQTLIAVGLITVFVLSIVTGIVVVNLLEKAAFRLYVRFTSVKEKTQDKPVARRVLGYCPVSMDITPKWFEKIFEP